ncbi:SusC/RagA family TonB-linked outer membrane protein [Arcticibacter tournemirensis]
MKPKTGCTGSPLPFFRPSKHRKQVHYSNTSTTKYNDDNRLQGLYIVLFYLLLIIILSLSDIISSYAQTIQSVQGRVVDEKGEPLTGAVVKIKGHTTGTSTGKNGEFSLRQIPADGVLIVSFIGYKTKELTVPAAKSSLLITMYPDATRLQEVEVVSTGYQQIPKERATGSFVQIDSTLLSRRVSTNFLDRLDGVTSGLVFNRQPGATDQNMLNFIQLRGRSTLGSYGAPLLVVDNFPYEGSITDINPNDIRSVTVLKDATAASVWGARSGNGVIVITTNKGRLNGKPQLTVSSAVSVTQKPDLYAASLPQLSAEQYIEAEQFLFNRGAYNQAISNGYTGLSPAVEIFLASKNGLISQADSLARINTLKGYDSRKDLLKYYYRHALNQQYYAAISGGSASAKYYFSAGYDKDLQNVRNSNNDRVSLNANHSYFLLDNRLELATRLVYTASRSESGTSVSGLYPYDRLADNEGNALALVNNAAGSLRLAYTDTAGAGKLLDWKYRPLDEIRKGYSTAQSERSSYLFNFSLNYRVNKSLNASLIYGYERGDSETGRLNEEQSFYTRNLINTFTQITGSSVTYGMPRGDILVNGENSARSHNGRFQADYNHTWHKHSLTALAGYEIRQVTNFNTGYTLYGYNPATATNQNAAIIPDRYYPYYYGSGSGTISTVLSQDGTEYHFLSAYANASYTYSGRYTASMSMRKDESNLFGVKTNQKGVPLWSAGLAWNAAREPFYHSAWLPSLKIRATFGYTGNVDNSLSALLTASGRSTNLNMYNDLYLAIVNPPNPSLRWEKVRNMNLGLDFGLKNNRLSGSVDLWRKKGVDLIGQSPLAPQTGVVSFKGNSANTRSKGVDMQLNSINMKGAFGWNTGLLYNYSKDEVTKYMVESGSNFSVVTTNSINPLPGYPQYAVFSFKYAGLDATGAPLGYLNGEQSNDYSGIYNSSNRADLVYNGPAVPVHSGSLMNTFTFKGFALSVNISYKLGYYFRRQSLDNSSLYGGNGVVYAGQADYDKRWQKPGDELITNVPALIYPANTYRSALYTYSDALVENAGNIRLRDLRLNYHAGKSAWHPFRNLDLFAYLDNAGIIWRANKHHIDPEPWYAVRSLSFGLKAAL